MKKPFYKTWWFIVIVVCVLASSIISFVDDKTGQADESTVEGKVTNFINKEFGKETNSKKERIVSVGYVDGTFEVLLNVDDNLSVNLMKTNMLSYATDIFEEVQKHEDIDTDVKVAFMAEVSDGYGNVKDTKILSIKLSQKTLDKIDFENFLYPNLETVADVYNEHTALK